MKKTKFAGIALILLLMITLFSGSVVFADTATENCQGSSIWIICDFDCYFH